MVIIIFGLIGVFAVGYFDDNGSLAGNQDVYSTSSVTQ